MSVNGVVDRVSVCPECTAALTVDADARQNEIVQCLDCMSELEICSVDPLMLGLAPDVEEDWGE